jgi:hypothetical protein
MLIMFCGLGAELPQDQALYQCQKYCASESLGLVGTPLIHELTFILV